MKSTHARSHPLPFHWPEPPLHLALVEPKIPPNTGNIARLCAATGCHLHLVEPLGFDIDEKAVRRAGLDYWESVNLSVHPDTDALWADRQPAPSRYHLFSTAGTQSLYDVAFEPGDLLLFGSETAGLTDDVLAAHSDRVVGIPIRTEHVRSLNLASSVAIAVYEALRQFQKK